MDDGESELLAASKNSTKSSADNKIDHALKLPILVPPYLFRTWCDQSYGTNSPTLFTSALSNNLRPRSHNGIAFDRSEGKFKDQLETSLYDKEAEGNPFVFFTSSMLFALQHAVRKTKKNKHVNCKGTNVQIICIDTQSAKNSNGESVIFHSVGELIEELTMKLSGQFTWDALHNEDVWATSDSIVPGLDSFYVPFETLKDDGLFQLFPEWIINEGLGDPGLEKPVTDLRRLWFRSSQDLSTNEINLAAKLAGLFRRTNDEENEQIPEHLFSWFLALKNQDLEGLRFREWLEDYSYPRSVGSNNSVLGRTFVIKEVDKYNEVYDVISRRLITAQGIGSLDVTVSEDARQILVSRYRTERQQVNAVAKRNRQEERERAEAAKKARLAALLDPTKMG